MNLGNFQVRATVSAPLNATSQTGKMRLIRVAGNATIRE
jgi:hypothetical protein